VTPTSGTARLNGFDISAQRSVAVLQIGPVLEGDRNVYWWLAIYVVAAAVAYLIVYVVFF
jgi:ABC-2 type transport system ATP-binding protein